MSSKLSIPWKTPRLRVVVRRAGRIGFIMVEPGDELDIRKLTRLWREIEQGRGPAMDEAAGPALPTSQEHRS